MRDAARRDDPPAPPAAPRPTPWSVYQVLRDTLYAHTLEHAKNLANKAYPVGKVTLTHCDTGEEHVRERGQWRQTHPAAQPELGLAGGPEDAA